MGGGAVPDPEESRRHDGHRGRPVDEMSMDVGNPRSSIQHVGDHDPLPDVKQCLQPGASRRVGRHQELPHQRQERSRTANEPPKMGPQGLTDAHGQDVLDRLTQRALLR